MGIGVTTRRVVLEVMLGLVAVHALHGSQDLTAWRAYEAVEEDWIRDRYQLLTQYAPAALNAARIDLELKLADLGRRAIQFRYLLSCNPALLRGGVWRMTDFSVSEAENSEMMASMTEYRKQTEQVREMTEALRSHPQYETLRRAQIRLWKTPRYREIHRKYMGRMQELQQMYGDAEPATIPASN